eukprot:TRINITY_DN1678_c0_g1_i6.p1 TRINITY_DN1678_c0_g1~~TRINITY_DN1678_c0_g1_i6.p1  ORF type:complete len:202 (+),score=37.20 TRINITY_DN1678_c0_g1_i6:198-803(+)
MDSLIPLLGWNNLDKAPKILLGICGAQSLMLLVGVFTAWEQDRCYIYVPEGGSIRIDCDDCDTSSGLHWRDWFVLLLGMAAIGVGVYGAIQNDRSTIRAYAYCMMCFAFVIGLACVLTSLEIPILEDARDENQAQLARNDDCRKTVDSMISSTRTHAILYVINTILDILGALFAMWTNVYVEYEQVKNNHEQAKSAYGSLL